MNRRILGLCLAASTAAAAAPAQTTIPVLTYESAGKMRDGCLAFARDKKLAVAIAVHDEAGRLVAFARTDGAPTGVSDVAIWKSRSAAIVRLPGTETAKWNLPTLPGVATVGGGVPVFASSGQPLGGIGVSGAQVEEDIACAEAGIRAAGLRS